MTHTPQPTLSPASFVAVYTPHKKEKGTPERATLSELLIKGDSTGPYTVKIQALKERFNDMYYTFAEKLIIISAHTHLSHSQHRELSSLFDELVETRELLEKDLISTP